MPSVPKANADLSKGFALVRASGTAEGFSGTCLNVTNCTSEKKCVALPYFHLVLPNQSISPSLIHHRGLNTNQKLNFVNCLFSKTAAYFTLNSNIVYLTYHQ